MDPNLTQMPDVEFWIAVKWIALLMITSGLATFAGLVVKRWWYGSAKRSRREDDEMGDTRGWLERFIKLKEETNVINAQMAQNMHDVLIALQANGDALRELARAAKCNFVEHSRGR